ncbi:MAG: hypothetical protein LBT38_00215 [Deltaproteobacteria bacterium]|jgi:tetratricopeptide (TPR) repeat protein|nr:hypothetical protein [Deltaproteobacteria bacterium]
MSDDLLNKPSSAADTQTPSSPQTEEPVYVSALSNPIESLMAADGEREDPQYRGLYLIGPLPESRGQVQERYAIKDDDDPYPPDLEVAIAERASLLALVVELKQKSAEETEEYRKTLQSITSLERRLALRWERLRSERMKLARTQSPGWVEYLNSLGLRHRFLARSIVSLNHSLEQAENPGPRNVAFSLLKNATELQNALPELTDLVELKLPSPKRLPPVKKAAETIVSFLEKERLRVLDRILVAEKLLLLAKDNNAKLSPAPEPEKVPRLSTEVVLMAKTETRPLKTLTTITVSLLLLAVIYLVVSKFFLSPEVAPDRPGRLLIVNGLSGSVNVFLDRDKPFLISPNSAQLFYPDSSDITAQTFMSDGPFIEEVKFSLHGPEDLATTVVYNVAGAAPLVERLGLKNDPDSLAKRDFLPLGAPRIYLSQANIFLPLAQWGSESIPLWSGGSQAENWLGLSAIAGLEPDEVLSYLKPVQLASKSPDPTVLSVLSSQAKLNPTWDEWISLWMSRLAQKYPKQALKVIKERWYIFPNDMTTRMFLFELSSEAERAELCQDTLARVAMESERVYDQYLLTWCLPTAERAPHLQQQLKVFVNDLWLLSALGRAEFDLGHYVEAYRLYKEVLSQDPRKMVFDMENLGRLERFLGRTGFEISEDIGQWLPELARKAIEEEREESEDPSQFKDPAKKEEEPSHIFRLLALGRLEEALKSLKESTRAEIAPLIAASHGLAQELMDELTLEILATPPEKGLTRDNAWTKLALALKLGQETKPIEDYIVAEAVDSKFASDILSQIKSQNTARIRELLVNQNARWQGDVCLALVLTAKESQDPVVIECEAKAKGFLFSAERPFLK